MRFTVLKKSKKSKARLGLLETAHGVVETPAFVPVATQAAVKTLTSEDAERAKCQALISNTFHLHLKPGERAVRSAGGLHNFMRWSRPLMTDSGGFQVFSLGFGRDFGTGKMLKKCADERRYISHGQRPREVKITERGVWFRSPMNGDKLFLGPKESMRIQEALGADIIFAFDECTSPIADYTYTKKSLEKTHRWAKECLKLKKSRQALFGIVQGGKFKDLRRESARFIGSLRFDGFGIGGEFGDNKKTMERLIGWTIAELPEDKPRHLLGIGHPEDIPRIIKAGVDTFDCIAPTHYARRGVAFTSHGKLDMTKRAFLKDKKPLDTRCECSVCGTYSRMYLAHLLRAKEIAGLSLLTFHNLYFFNSFVADIRGKIKRGIW